MFRLLFCLLFIGNVVMAQTAMVQGVVYNQDGGVVPFASVVLKHNNHKHGVSADENGVYTIANLQLATYTVNVSAVGFKLFESEIALNENKKYALNITLTADVLNLEQVVVTGTKTFKRKINSAVIVNVIDNKTLNNVQACNLAEGLRFQPGLRVETDCQTCNYTQLRMNGLAGGYSQLLINGRPIFSPLAGLYSMEQIPTNMIERIEVVRGGGSVLYGSSAIGGTVNIITKIPKRNSYSVGYNYQNINGKTSDHQLNASGTVVSKNKKMGVSLFLAHRTRGLYDHNNDNFSELPSLKNNSLGINAFFQPKENQKLELSISSLNETRYGGEMVEGAAHFAQQSEDRLHNIVNGNIDYQLNFNNDNSSFITYAAFQHTKRNHYTGIFPDDSLEIANHVYNPPYGNSTNTTLQAGVQVNHRVKKFIIGENVLTVGSEFLLDDILDVIDAYNYKIDQTTNNFGFFLQSDWSLTPNFTILSGVRMDKHNLVNSPVFSPRVSLLYKLKKTTQFRVTWASGFRAPQAFDADLHIAFAGGGISRIGLAENLKQERSQSLSGSVNFDKAKEKFIVGFTVEGFYTRLNDAFYLHPLGEDQFGELFEKRNGAGASVQGATLEARFNYNRKLQLEGGFTFQTSLYDEAVEVIEGLEAKRNFLRTPNVYGYSTLQIMPWKNFNTTLNMVYTGKMDIAHFAGAPEQTTDQFKTTKGFAELSLRTSYTFALKKMGTNMELLGGVKNIFNAYQSDFDSGKNRDSNYVYGPSLPRTYFVGLKFEM